ncbi:MAG: MBL fold metallo-hydrolase [Ruminococcaceae bacterium]|nr:MBL fold metallo-hydrolase [Oscillospiraceae bacterium]
MGKLNPWEGYLEPCKVFGNLYFVGTVPASTHIIDTGDGLIMLDSGYQHSLYIVLHNMYLLGLDPKKLKYIVHTHGHIDHMGATQALVQMFGCKTFLGEPDKDYVNGVLPLSWAKELGLELIPFEADVLLNDGDKITLGNTEITAVATPGHTPGAMSYFFDVTDGKETYRAALHGGMGTNTMKAAFLDEYGLPYSCRDDFIASQTRLADMKCDIYLGNHAGQNKTPEKIAKVLAGDTKAFVDPYEWKREMIASRDNLINMIKECKL